MESGSRLDRVTPIIPSVDASATDREVEIPVGEANLHGVLQLPSTTTGMVLFVHGSGSSRHSPRNQMVARRLREGGLGTLLFDLLTAEEERVDAVTRHLRFDIGLLARRLVAVTDWLVESEGVESSLGYFGSSTGAAAALIGSTVTPHEIRAVVSRGGRPDLAGDALPAVRAATLLIVGGDDPQVLQLNREALANLDCEKELCVVTGATHLFEEPGKLEIVAETARRWFVEHLS